MQSQTMSSSGTETNDSVATMGKRNRSDSTGSDANKKERSSITASKVNASNIHDYNEKVSLKIQPFDSGVGRHPLFYHLVKSFILKEGIGMKAEMMEGVKKMNISMNNSITALLDKITKMNPEKWESLATFITDAAQTSKQEHELFYSSSLATCLSIFCHKESLPFAFTHQPASKKSNNSCADIGVYYFGHASGTDTADDNIDYEANFLLGLNEAKKSDTDDTELQLGCYLSQARKENKSARVFFGFTMNTTWINMYGYCIDESRNLEHSLLFRTDLANSAKFLQAYFLSLAIVSDQNIRCKEQCADNFCPLVEAKVKRVCHKVFRADDTDRLYKVFDYGPARRAGREPNIKIAQLVYGEDNVELHKDEGDTRNKCNVYVLETPWFDGYHKPACVDHVRLLCNELQKLHEKDFVHGDVLRQNIIFGGEEGAPTTTLIDFDYSGKEVMKKYPTNWNTGFPERHPDVGEWNGLDKIHDVYAAIVILCMFFEFKDGEVDSNGNQREIHRDFFEFSGRGGDEEQLKLRVPSAEHHPNLKCKFSAKEVSDYISTHKNKFEPRNNALDDDGFVVKKKSSKRGQTELELCQNNEMDEDRGKRRRIN